MTITTELSRIEATISRLSHRERLWLIERLVHQLRTEESGSELREDEIAQQELGWPAIVGTPAERGARLWEQSHLGQAQWAAGMAKVMEELGISGEPIGAEELQKMFAECGIKPEDNEFSRGIIEMREE